MKKTIKISKSLFEKIDNRIIKEYENEDELILNLVSDGFHDIIWYYTNGNEEYFPNNIDIKLFTMLNYFNNTKILKQHTDKFYKNNIILKNENINNFIDEKNTNNLCFDKINDIQSFLDNPQKKQLDCNNKTYSLLQILTYNSKKLNCNDLIK